ncbi:hypothetical protein F511_47389 [Dorcoceras hygrometricum]|uniref:Uncharacterized protein n=1 Tax=Dorcoceras hygrometricum TaxID=472368 RepID=A0A2Z6ZR82_9LAMI|nr:hypothetical protein F511_47389 [Dorcoceras hygrometricum]
MVHSRRRVFVVAAPPSPAAAPASLRRCRDGWSVFFQGLVRACPGQPVKFSGL